MHDNTCCKLTDMNIFDFAFELIRIYTQISALLQHSSCIGHY